MTVDEFIRVFAAQRPNLDWVQAVQQLLPALDREQVTALLAALPRAGRRTHVELVRLLAPHLDRAQVAEVATIIATTKGAGSRLAALGCVADRLPDAQRDDAVAGDRARRPGGGRAAAGEGPRVAPGVDDRSGGGRPEPPAPRPDGGGRRDHRDPAGPTDHPARVTELDPGVDELTRRERAVRPGGGRRRRRASSPAGCPR
ncbi:hypothetical protein GCM10009827_027970 [Dactylosporangium maewongense]|uniref:Uncharacterized protein n=1 Tax=Dactylosporangium maewongense TaxID=634393 RepID=A0ABN2A6L6_9ACTN